jgi:hypothetical protein
VFGAPSAAQIYIRDVASGGTATLADGATAPLSRRHRARLLAALNPAGR